ncbi:hypothetical protein JTB14_019713 [Gonioctena quinquepunctata]|nr:hypothetical protein JTB14_019713 [Gonioctena quinquepunctata]
MASCDAFYRFTLVDIGAAGGNHDSVVFSLSGFGNAILSKKLKIPDPKKLPNSDIEFPSLFAADAAFPLHKSIMRPYPGQNLTACVVLHNFVQRSELEIPENERRYCPTGFAAKSQFGMRKTDLRSVRRVGSNNAKREYIELRNTLCEYVNSPQGSVPWQLEEVLRGCVPQGFMGVDIVDDMINM